MEISAQFKKERNLFCSKYRLVEVNMPGNVTRRIYSGDIQWSGKAN